MKLTDEQKAEIRDYIVTVPKYRETYNELYDHILNSFEDSEVAFSIDEVNNIVNRDFGGFSEVIYQEKIYQKEVGKKFKKEFWLQFIDTAKWDGIFFVAFYYMFYNGNKTTPINLKVMVLATTIIFIAVAVYGYSRILINRRRYSKYSILDNYLVLECSFSLAIINVFLHVFINSNFFELSHDGKVTAVLIFLTFAQLYARTFFKLYNQKFKVLTA